MKIFVEGTPLFLRRTGVGQYTKNLLEVLLKNDRRNRYTIFGFLFVGKKFTSKPFPRSVNLDYRLIRYMPSKVFNALVRKLFAPPIDLMLGSKPDLFLFPNFVRYPLVFHEKSIIVVYDLSFLLHGQYTAKRNREYLTRYVPGSVRRANHVITISENSKKEIIEAYGTDPQKISIVHPAIDHKFFYPRNDAEIDQVKKKYKISRPYILYTGTLEPRKNINGILSAYEKLDSGLQRSFTLVLAGGKGWLDKDIKQHLDKLSSLDIKVTGYVPDADLPALYSGASVFVYPSFYEGFGMPPLEAMACGVPVVTANNSSLPEVVGDAGVLIRADDTPALTSAVQEVLSDNQLAQNMRGKGLARAKQFSWESSAEKMLEVINSVGGQR